jgi:hypothetical protein
MAGRNAPIPCSAFTRWRRVASRDSLSPAVSIPVTSWAVILPAIRVAAFALAAFVFPRVGGYRRPDGDDQHQRDERQNSLHGGFSFLREVTPTGDGWFGKTGRSCIQRDQSSRNQILTGALKTPPPGPSPQGEEEDRCVARARCRARLLNLRAGYDDGGIEHADASRAARRHDERIRLHFAGRADAVGADHGFVRLA